MKLSGILKTALFVVPLGLGTMIASIDSGSAGSKMRSLAACNAPSAMGTYKVIINVDNNNGSPSISFTNYTLKFAVPPQGKPAKPSATPFIFVCLTGTAKPTFIHTSKGRPVDAVIWKNNPGDFSRSRGAGTHKPDTTMYIIKNTNKTNSQPTAGGPIEYFHYTVKVQTDAFGEMEIDPRVQNGGGGNAN